MRKYQATIVDTKSYFKTLGGGPTFLDSKFSWLPLKEPF
jgi:hypothetical protein